MPKLIKLKSIDREGNTQTFESITQAAEYHKCNESSIRKVVNKPQRYSCGRQWVTDEVIEEASTELSPDFIENLEKLGITKDDLGLVWAKQGKDGEFRYSISFKKDDKIDTDNIINKFKEAVTSVQPISIPQGITNKRTLLVYTSDKHLGAKTNDNSLFENTYDEGEFARRMDELIMEIIILSKNLGKFEKIVIVDLGDAVDGLNGQTTRGGHSLPQNMTLEQSFDLYFTTHKKLFDTLIAHNAANTYQFRALSNDNHSGAVGHLTYRGLEIYLNAAYPDIETYITDKFITHFTLGQHVFMLSHGKDREDRPKGLPLHLDEKTKNFISSYIDHYELQRPAGFVHFIKGDLHQASSQLTKKFRYRNCLSMYGASAWIQNNFGGGTIAGVSMDIIEEDFSMVFERTLIFD